MNIDHNNLVREAYGRRASQYDDSHGGWHVKLGQDFVNWIDPQPGEKALDLACGTGLVTLPMAVRLGSKGRVVAVDLTAEMIQEGQERLSSLQKSDAALNIAPISWIEADITSENILNYPEVRSVLQDDGGFDIISICSALVLLPDQQGSMQFWIDKLLKRGGRIIVDVPDETPTLQLLLTYHLPAAIGLPVSMAEGRLWIKDQHSLAQMLNDTGLIVEHSISTDSYVEEVWYDGDEKTALHVLNRQIKEGSSSIEDSGKSTEARKVWPQIWTTAVRKRADGGEGIEEAHRLYVCVGRKT